MTEMTESIGTLAVRVAALWSKALATGSLAEGDTLTVFVPVPGGVEPGTLRQLSEAFRGTGFALATTTGTNGLTVTKTRMPATPAGQASGTFSYTGEAQGVSPSTPQDEALEIQRQSFELLAIIARQGISPTITMNEALTLINVLVALLQLLILL